MISTSIDQCPARLSLRQRGISLLEVLVALALLVNGMLGIFSLQTTSLARQQQAYLRTQTLLLADDPVMPWSDDSRALVAAGATFCPPKGCDLPGAVE